MEGTQENHKYYRDIVCKHIEENSTLYEMFVDVDQDGNLDKYLNRMKRLGVFGYD